MFTFSKSQFLLVAAPAKKLEDDFPAASIVVCVCVNGGVDEVSITGLNKVHD